MKISDRGKSLIRGIEQLKIESYLDQAKVWTIGYGTTKLNGSNVTSGMIINKKVAEALFDGDLLQFSDVVERAVSVLLNQNQFDALVSFTYNIGKGGFLSSTLLKTINNKLKITEDLFTRWNKITVNGKLQVSNGLTRRRKEEYQLFMEP
jgi:lysozyme